MSCKVSVIIPVYNCIKYLEKAIKSVISQTEFNSIELILVDDGSSDGSERICDEYSAKYPNIIAIHQINSGVSVARNMGISSAKGEYIAFLDSDDEYTSDFIHEMLYAAESDLVCCDYVKSGTQDKQLGADFENRVYKAEEMNYDFYKKIIHEEFYSCWNKLYKREIIERYGLSFTPGVKYAEDMVFVYEYLRHCKTFRFIEKPLYRYNVNPNNVTSVVKNGFDVQLYIYEYHKSYFSDFDFYDSILKDISERFVYKTTCSINSEITYGSFLGAYRYIKHVLSTQFYDLYMEENYTDFGCKYDKVFFSLLKKKKALTVVIWRKIFDLRSKIFHE